ncbi:MAG: ParB/RepB/Spo0J family partition protein [Alphaproteobacteria bacterium]
MKIDESRSSVKVVPKRKGLGKGLSALLGDDEETVTDTSRPRNTGATPASAIQEVPLFNVHPNAKQPREYFDDEALGELAQSIQSRGVLQPLLVRERKDGSDHYDIIAGERRWRACRKVGLATVPVFIKSAGETDVLEMALIENIQREDLNPIEEAEGFHTLLEDYGCSQNSISEAIGKSRSYVANTLRLLSLPTSVRKALIVKEITTGHARVLLSSKEPEKWLSPTIKKGLSVRALEELIKSAEASLTDGDLPPIYDDVVEKMAEEKRQKEHELSLIEKRISSHIGVPVKVTVPTDKKAGRVILQYKTLEQLDDLLQFLANAAT